MSYPAPNPARRNRNRLIVLGAVVAALLLCGGVSILVMVGGKAADKAGAVVDRVDSGVQACKYIAEGKDPNGKPTTAPDSTGQKFTQADYTKLRKVFDDSRHDDIQAAGTKFVDTMWKVEQAGDAGALAFFGDIITDYAGLSLACGAHGHPLPALSGK